MDISEILNNTIAGLICTIIVSLFTIFFKLLKKKYNENRELLLLRIHFTIALVGLICSLFSNIDENFFPLWLKTFCIVINFLGLFTSFEDAINYKK